MPMGQHMMSGDQMMGAMMDGMMMTDHAELHQLMHQLLMGLDACLNA